MTRIAALTLALALTSARAARADWPPAATQPDATDPLHRYRWASMPVWTSLAGAPTGDERAQRVASGESPCERSQQMSVLLRLQARADEAAAELSLARSQCTDGITDPDARLTAAWLDARLGRFERAADEALAALTAMPASPHHDALLLAVARWSIAAGPAGLARAGAIIEALRVAGAASGRAVTLAALIRARQGDEAGARATLHSSRRVLSALVATPLGVDRDDPGFVEQVNAVALALILDGRAAEAAPLLQRTAQSTPPPWSDFQQRMRQRAGL